MPVFDKTRLPSRHVSLGPERAPHRSYYYAMGISEEDIQKPFVALASAGNDSSGADGGESGNNDGLGKHFDCLIGLVKD